MIYSCFDDKSGLYKYFSDEKQVAINSDLPVPTMPRVIKGIGAASIDAARPRPSSAKPIGTGWLPRGIIVKCGAQGVGDFTSDASSWFTKDGWKWIVGGAAVILVLKNI